MDEATQNFVCRLRDWIAPQLSRRDSALLKVSNDVSLETRLRFGQMPDQEIWEVSAKEVKDITREAKHGRSAV
jgi:hypothetical protein